MDNIDLIFEIIFQFSEGPEREGEEEGLAAAVTQDQGRMEAAIGQGFTILIYQDFLY